MAILIGRQGVGGHFNRRQGVGGHFNRRQGVDRHFNKARSRWPF